MLFGWPSLDEQLAAIQQVEHQTRAQRFERTLFEADTRRQHASRGKPMGTHAQVVLNLATGYFECLSCRSGRRTAEELRRTPCR